MRMKFPTWTKPGIWGAVLGAILITIVGFSSDFVVSNDTAQAMAQERSDNAIIAALTPICVAQFKSESQQDMSRHLAAMKKESSWDRGDYVEKQGWATMPAVTQPIVRSPIAVLWRL